MAYLATSPTGTTVIPPITYTVTPRDPVGAVVIGPLTASWFQITLFGSDDYDGDTEFEYEDVTGAFDAFLGCDGAMVARGDAVTQIGFGGGNWGTAFGGSRPKLTSSNQMRVRARIAVHATQGFCRILIRLLP